MLTQLDDFCWSELWFLTRGIPPEKWKLLAVLFCSALLGHLLKIGSINRAVESIGLLISGPMGGPIPVEKRTIVSNCGFYVPGMIFSPHVYKNCVKIKHSSWQQAVLPPPPSLHLCFPFHPPSLVFGLWIDIIFIFRFVIYVYTF